MKAVEWAKTAAAFAVLFGAMWAIQGFVNGLGPKEKWSEGWVSGTADRGEFTFPKEQQGRSAIEVAAGSSSNPDDFRGFSIRGRNEEYVLLAPESWSTLHVRYGDEVAYLLRRGLFLLNDKGGDRELSLPVVKHAILTAPAPKP